MEKRKNEMPQQINGNSIILGGIIFILLMVTGILPFAIKLVVGLVVGIVGLVVGLVVGAIGLIVGLAAGAVALVVGLLPIVIPVAIIVWLVGNRKNSSHEAKRKNDFEVDIH